jgi:AAA ATPase domain
VQHRQAPLDLFVGRTAELKRMAEVVTRAEAGQPWLVAIEGVPAVGKTALARRCLAEATGLRVLSARAGQTEADLDFGVVEQLVRAAAGALPLISATGGTDSPSSSFAVGARLLEVVGEQEAKGTVAILIDNLQWADRKSVEALTFVLRRLSVDPVVAFVIYRGPSDRLNEAAQRMLLSIENRLQITLGGLETAANRGPNRLRPIGAGGRRPGTNAGRERSSQLLATRPGLAARVADGTAGYPRGGQADLPARRGYRPSGKPGSRGSVAAGLRPAAAAHRQQEGGGRASSPGECIVPGLAGCSFRSPGRTGTGGVSPSR